MILGRIERRVKLQLTGLKGPRRFSIHAAGAARFLVLAVLFFAGHIGSAYAASTPDPCVSASFKQSASVAITSATTTSVVAGVAGKNIFVCGYTLTLNGTGTTATSAQFEYGAQGGPCTSPTVLTGALGGQAAGASTQGTAATVIASGNGGATVMTVPAGSQLCILSTGTGSSFIEGVVTYIQSTGNSYP
jgi:hypothetical protein